MRDNVTDTLFYFLRVGLFGVQGDSTPPVQLEQLDWQQLYDTAKAQGVLAIVFDGVKRVMEALGDNTCSRQARIVSFITASLITT